MEEIHTKVQEIISSPHLAMKIIYNVSRCWILYLNMCVDTLAFEALEALGSNVPILLNTILVKLEEGSLCGKDTSGTTGGPYCGTEASWTRRK